MRALRRLAPWFLLRPITGPLTEGVYRNLLLGKAVLASLYAIAIPVTWLDLIGLIRVMAPR